MKINRTSPDRQEYLKILSDIAKSPEKLHFIGKLPEQRSVSVAIVGSRKPTAYGKEVTYQLAYDLAKKGVIIISGLALGIDSIAHRAALDAGGRTIAVLASGLDIITPASNQQLADDIIRSGGAILSEYPPGRPALSHQFLERNRLVSGLADMVVVTEAAKRSGTLSTVGHALEQGKEVGVVPGNITSLLSAGCNMLIKQGAQVITSVEDILNTVKPELVEEQASLPLGETEAENIIINLIQNGISDGDELLKHSKLPSEEFSTAMTMLELSGVVKALGGNKWRLH